MKTYLKGLDEEIKVEDEIYRERLIRCEECDNLTDGICKICGCFVEYRAAMKAKGCPAIHQKW